MPIMQEGAKIVSTQSKANNALQYDNENLSLKVSGNWEVLHGDIFCIVVVKNRGQDKITIDFNKMTVANSFSEKLIVEAISTAFRNKPSEAIESKIAEIDAGQTLAFGVDTGEKNSVYKGNVKFRGNEIWMTIPVAIEQNKAFSTSDYNFRFKYADYQPEGNNDEGLIN